jgi:adenylate cyclase
MSVPPIPKSGPEPGPESGPVVAAAARLDADDIAAMLVGKPREFSRNDISRLSGVSVLGARKFWHALGFPMGASNDRFFTEADLRALRRIALLVRGGVLDERTALALARAFARTADRLAAWQVQLLTESVILSSQESAGLPTLPDGWPGRSGAGPGFVARRADAEHGGIVDLDGGVGAGPEPDLAPMDESTAQATARRVLDLADELEPMLVYAWRRHLNDAVARMLADASEHEQQGLVRVIGFADLVAFTSLVRQLRERDVARLVERFEAIVSDIVTAHGGRIVKTVGDEVLFACVQPAPGAAIALDLVDALAEEPMLPQVRVGCAYGPVLARLGDVFGITVNRAARLTPLAHPGTVLIDRPLAAALASQSGFDVTPMRRRTLRGVGPVVPHLLMRSNTPTRRGRYP